SNLSNETIRAGHQMESKAIRNCQLAVYSSDWAAQSAITRYKADPKKVKVIPFGANIPFRRESDSVRKLILDRSRSVCKLLFIGMDWYRKGGDKAVDVALRLNESGIRTELITIGCMPNLDRPLPSFVKQLGFISKDLASGRQKIEQLIGQSHFLILPSRADCTPIVVSEANSLGVPVLCTNVGGLPTIVHSDMNGKLFSLDEKTAKWCSYISDLLENYDNYQSLALSSLEEYLKRLNWTSSTTAIKELLMTI
ncbi:MAG: glycosyltransferase family 4 protein, partial [Cyanobacteria bacterium J06631_9]